MQEDEVPPSDGQGADEPTVVIIGAGLSGLLMGIKLKESGINSFVIYEKADDVGGTWRENTYPGLVCDIPSRFYQYSFAPNPDWSRWFPPRSEIQDYLRWVADTYDLWEYIRFGHEVSAATYGDGRWQVTTAAGEQVVADVLVSATGFLHHPRYPDIPGLDTFAGPAFHSARWDHEVALAGRRIGVIGSGSTGVQLVSALSEVAGTLVSFQRTPQWVLPLPNPRYSRLTKWLYRRFPALNGIAYRAWQQVLDKTLFTALVRPGWQRVLFDAVCHANLRTVRERELRRRLTPSYQPGCKRIVLSPGFYRAMQKPNVELVSERIDHVEPRGVVTQDGVLHELDVLALATGFDAHAYLRPMALVGRDGISLDDAWRQGVRSYRTVALPGFPNFFMLIGPYSPVNNDSLFALAEKQVNYVMQLVRMIRDGQITTAEPTEEATAAFEQDIRDAVPGTVYATGCHSWYLDQDGTPTVWPWRPTRQRDMLSQPASTELQLR